MRVPVKYGPYLHDDDDENDAGALVAGNDRLELYDVTVFVVVSPPGGGKTWKYFKWSCMKWVLSSFKMSGNLEKAA